MKKDYLKYLVFLSAILLLQTNSLYSQRIKYEYKYDTLTIKKSRVIRLVTVRTVPKFILQISGAYNSGALELTGHNGGFSWYDFANGRIFGARNGFGVNVVAKLPLHKKGKFWINASSGFNRFVSDLVASNTEEGRVAYNMYTGGIGADYNFTPSDKVKYFIGTEILASVIWGNSRLVTTDHKNELATNVIDVKINSAFRMGYTAYVGMEYAFEKNVGLNVGFKFTHANLLFKKSIAPTDPFERELNDDPGDFAYAGWKQFAYGSIFGGMSIYFGVKEKRYKMPY